MVLDLFEARPFRAPITAPIRSLEARTAPASTRIRISERTGLVVHSMEMQRT